MNGKRWIAAAVGATAIVAYGGTVAGTCACALPGWNPTPSGTSPSSLSFGSQDINNAATASQTETITNTGGSTLTFTSVTITGTNASEFSITSNACTGTIAGKATCTIQVAFDPSTVGAKTATLTVSDNATGSPQTVPLTGTGTSSGGATTANLFLVASGGSANCTRSASLIDYTTASSTNHVCGPGGGYSPFDNACRASNAANAATGTLALVRAGNYSGDGDFLVSRIDCSPQGASVNPNAVEQGVTTGNMNGWLHFACADGDNTKNVVFGPAYDAQIFKLTAHVLVSGGCWDFGGIYVNNDHDIPPANNIAFVGGPGCVTNPASTDCMHVTSLSVLGAANVLFKNMDHGPLMMCVYNANTSYPAYQRCNPSYPFENAFNAPQFAGDPGGLAALPVEQQDFIHFGADNYQNIRFENVYEHDLAAPYGGIHSGCIQTDDGNGFVFPANNLVFDHIVCERETTALMQLADSGETVENSWFTCATYPFDQFGSEIWDGCAPGFTELGMGCKAGVCNPGQYNQIYRNNVFISLPGDGNAASISSWGETYTNAWIVGNLFVGTGPPMCSGTGIGGAQIIGIICDRNAFAAGTSTAGTNAVTLTCSNPLVQAQEHTSDHLFRYSVTTNVHLSGSCTVPTYDASGLSSVYKTPTDGDGVSRAPYTSMRYGAYQAGG